MLTLLRFVLAPLRTPFGRRALLGVLALGALWWWQGWRVMRWLGPPRLPEGRVTVELEPEREGPPPAGFEARYGALGPAELAAHLAALEARYERERRTALDRRRAAGDVLERPYAAGGATAVPPEVPADAIFEVVYDPAEAGRTPVAWTVWLPRDGHEELYALRDELAFVRRRSGAP